MDKKISPENIKELILQLEEHKEMYRTLSRVSPVGIIRTSPDGQCVYVNQKWQSLAGMNKQHALGDGWQKAIHPDDRARIVDSWMHCVKNELNFADEYRLVTPAGEVRWVLAQANIVNSGGKRHVGTITNVTKKKRVLSQLLKIKNGAKCRSA